MISFLIRSNPQSEPQQDAIKASSEQIASNLNGLEKSNRLPPPQRQLNNEANRIRDLSNQLSELRLASMTKDQQIARLNRELAERDRIIGILRRNRDPCSPKSSLSSLPMKKLPPKGRIARENQDIDDRPILTVSTFRNHNSGAKKPTRPFINFCSVNRGVLKMRNPDLSAAEITRLLSEEWRSMTPLQQAEYINS